VHYSKRADSLIVDLILSKSKAYVNDEITDCSLAIDQGKIIKIGKEPSMPKTEKKLDLKNLLILPGLIDAHVHLRDEGKSYKEDFLSGTAAAAAGGITTVLDMPNNKPVTMSIEAIRKRMRLAERKALVNVGFYSEFPESVDKIERIGGEGVVAFKLYMVEQVGGLNIDDDSALSEAFTTVSGLNLPVAVHAEDKATLKRTEDKCRRANCNSIEAFLEAHSEKVETTAVKRLLNIAKQTNVHIHFCHISTESALKVIIKAKRSGVMTTCETTPHHLLLSADDLKRIGGSALTMPPMREKHHNIALWRGVQKGWIDVLSSDHAPHSLAEKEAHLIWDTKAGIPGLETILPLILTQVKHGKISIAAIVRLMSEKPAEIFGLNGKGCLKKGNDADLVAVDLHRKYRVDASDFLSKAKYSPFDRLKIEGKPVKTFVAGQLVMDEGEIVAKPGSGEVIRRG